MIIKTSALEFDDRLRKEVRSCQSLGYEVSVECLLDENIRAKGQVWKGVHYHSYRLWSRCLLPGHRFVALHVIEFVLRLLFARHWLALRGRSKKVVWVHDPVLMPFLPVAAFMRFLDRIDHIVWDQHELPPESWLRSRLQKMLLRRACRIPDSLIVANESRASYLKSSGVVESHADVFVIHNYADNEYALQPIYPLPDALTEWLGGKNYLLVQSGGTSLRCAETVFEALLSDRWPDTKVVFVGGADPGLVEHFRSRNTVRFDQRVWLEGKVPQLSLGRFADHALASVILYKASSPNQVYCEPNRMYQALCRGLPVIVGNNPPMADVVRKTGAGLILDDDGDNPFELVAAVRTICLSEACRDKARLLSEKFRWQQQLPTIEKCLKPD